jgi:hypothetical protein
MNRFIHPETAILTLANGDTLVVKQRLNTGERRKMFASMYRESANGDGRDRVDPLKTGVSTVLAYLLDWSLTDDGRPVPIRDQGEDVVRGALDALDYESFTEILRAIEAHEIRQDEARALEKKSPAGASGSSPTSPSPSGVAGATSGSPNSIRTST